MAITYPSTKDVFSTKVAGDSILASHINDLQDAVEMLESRYGNTGNENIPSGTKMLFYANTAPNSGWTIVTSIDDVLVFQTKGSGAGGQTGGGVHSTGSWTIS